MSIFFPQCFGFLSAVLDGFGGGNSSPQVIPFLPRHASVLLNGYREADTFEVEFDAKAFPFSPELIRSAAVELYVFQTDGLLVDGLQKHVQDDVVFDFSQFQTHDRTDEVTGEQIRGNLVVTGLVDNASLQYGTSGRSLRLSGKDYTSLLVGRDWPPDKRVPVGKSLKDTVQDLVDESIGSSSAGTTLTVRYLDPADVKTVAQGRGLTQKSVTTQSPEVGKKHHPAVKAKGFPVRSGKNYWDVIYGLCLDHGKICYVSGFDVVISDPHTLTQASAQTAAKVAYGRNLRQIEFERAMGKEAVPQVQTFCYDPLTRKQVLVKFPDPVTAQVRQSGQQGQGAADVTGVGTVRESVLKVPPPQGVTDPEMLRSYLKSYYHNVARHEGSMRFQTKSLSDLDGNDLIHLRPGDPVLVSFDAFSVEDLRQLKSDGEREDRLRELGYSKQVAQLVANNFDKLAQLQTPYYVKDVALTWSNSDGLEIDVEGINYIAPARDDVAS